jgi:hypothetical protein
MEYTTDDVRASPAVSIFPNPTKALVSRVSETN